MLLQSCTSLSYVSLPSTLKVIERGVFWRCAAPEEITIPASVEKIGDYAFYGCVNLNHIYNYATKPQAITLMLDNFNTVIHVPAASVNLYKKHPNRMILNIVGDL